MISDTISVIIVHYIVETQNCLKKD